MTVRLSEDLARWLREHARRLGVPAGRIIRDELERARSGTRREKRFLRLAGVIEGPPDLSQRRGFSSK